LRRVDLHLDRLLIGDPSEAIQGISRPLFAVADHAPRRGIVHGIADFLQRPFELHAHLGQIRCSIQLGQRLVHGNLRG
jgi:hypothetical protein